MDKAKLVDFLAELKEYRGDDCTTEHEGAFFGWESFCLTNGASPNFYPDNSNEAMIELCGDEKFNEFVKLCAEKIKAFLDFSPENYK